MKKISLLLAVFMAVAVFAGCQSGGKSTGGKKVELNVVTSYGGDDGNRQNYEEAYKAYEQASGNVIKDASGTSNEDWKARIMTDFETGAEPDVLFFFTGVDSNKLVEGGKVVSIDEIREKYPDYASNMKDEMLAVSPADGKKYAVPVNGFWETMFVNKKVLADCGVAVPGADYTWDQFMADCQTILDKGYTPIAASLQEVPHYWFEFCVYNNGDTGNHLDLPQSATDATGQKWAAGLNDIKELYEKGFFPKNTTTSTDAETNVLMTDNKAAFMIDGHWKVGWFQENAADINDFTVAFVPGKGSRKATDVVGGFSMGYYITKKAWDNPEKQAACVDFIKAMTKDDVVAKFASVSMSALKNGTPPPENADALVKSVMEMTKNSTSVVGATQDGLNQTARTALFMNVKKIVAGEMTPEEAIDECIQTKE